MSLTQKLLSSAVEKYYEENSMYALKDRKFHLAELGNDAGIYGTVRMVMFK